MIFFKEKTKKVDLVFNIQNKVEETEEGKGWLSRTSLFLLEVIKMAVLAAITIGLVRYFLFKPFYVKGQSMEPNFIEKDYLIIDEISYRFREPQRGDVVVFHSPINNDYYLKRIIALPGERIKISDNKVIVYNDDNPGGIVVIENYLEEETPGSDTKILGKNQYYVMGDNRDASYDSRRFGAIERKEIVGRFWLRGWPFSRLSTFKSPDYNNL